MNNEILTDIRDADSTDESWLLQKIDKELRDEANFRPQDFRIAMDEKTEERVAFGRVKYHRDEDGTEHVEIADLNLLNKGTKTHACRLMDDLADRVIEGNNDIVYSISTLSEDIHESVGFDKIPPFEVPEIISTEYMKIDSATENPVNVYVARPWDIKFDEDKDDDVFKKEYDKEVEIESLKEEFSSPDQTYKYHT